MIPIQLKGLRFNRVKFKDKRAFEKDWQNNPYTYEEIQNYFPKENYGVICGKDIRVLDDDTEKKGLITLFLENFGETFRVRDHLYFKFEEGVGKKIIFKSDVLEFDDGKGGKTNHMGELQGEGTYVVGAGCTHPSGEIYNLVNDVPIKKIPYEKFMKVFGDYVVGNNTKKVEKNDIVFNVDDDNLIKSVKEKWMDGDRQNLTLDVSGYLRKEKRLGLNTTTSIIKKICEDCGDDDFKEREKGIIATYEKDENKIKGVSGLVERNISLGMKKDIAQHLLLRNEDQASEEIVEYIMENNFIYTTRDDLKSEIWVYDNGIYKPNGESFIKEIIREILEKAYTSQRGNRVIAKIEADTMIDSDKFFGMSYLDEICVNNGVLNLNTRVLGEFDPKKIFFNKLPVDYKAGEKCNNINTFFGDILKDQSDKKILFELIGFCLHKDYFIEKAFMFLGDGRNGKGKTLSLIREFLGTKNTCSVRLSQMDAGNSSLNELHNRLVNLAGDLNNTALKDTGLFKELTGRDEVQIKRKYLRDLIFTNYAKMVFACNELPKVYDLSEGFWSRWVLLEFPYKFLPQHEIDVRKDKKNLKVQDPNIINKLTIPQEMTGLLNEALDGLDRIKKNKDFSYSVGTAVVKDTWIRKSDSFTAFCLDNLEEDYDGFVVKRKLRSEFLKYCKKHKAKGVSDRAMKVVLEDMFGCIEGRKSVDMIMEHCWDGIKFKEKDEKVDDLMQNILGK